MITYEMFVQLMAWRKNDPGFVRLIEALKWLDLDLETPLEVLWDRQHGAGK